jgi:hypothetical protein
VSAPVSLRHCRRPLPLKPEPCTGTRIASLCASVTGPSGGVLSTVVVVLLLSRS